MSELEAMLEADEDQHLEAFPVNTRVGNVRNDDEGLVQRLEEDGSGG